MPQLVSTPRNDYIFTPCASLRPSYFCIYTKVEKYIKCRDGSYLFSRVSSKNKSSFLPDSANNRYTSERLTAASAQKLRNVISLLVACSSKKSLYDPELKRHVKFRVNFITLTLSGRQCHSDKEVVKLLLEPFLRAFRDKCPGLLYVWKAEKQDNDNIHFHITSNRYVSAFVLRRMWNKIQAKAGYLHYSRIREINSTDVHAVKQNNTLSRYLTSYVTKKDYYKKPLKKYFKKYGNKLKNLKADFFRLPKNYFKNIKDGIKCRLWDCSTSLKRAKCIIEDLDGNVSAELNYLLRISKKISVSDFVKSAEVAANGYYQVPTLRRVWYNFLDALKREDEKSVGIY